MTKANPYAYDPMKELTQAVFIPAGRAFFVGLGAGIAGAVMTNAEGGVVLGASVAALFAAIQYLQAPAAKPARKVQYASQTGIDFAVHKTVNNTLQVTFAGLPIRPDERKWRLAFYVVYLGTRVTYRDLMTAGLAERSEVKEIRAYLLNRSFAEPRGTGKTCGIMLTNTGRVMMTEYARHYYPSPDERKMLRASGRGGGVHNTAQSAQYTTAGAAA